MKLHIIRISPSSRKVLAVVNHLGLDIDYNILPSFSGATMQPAFTAINPHGKVPVLEDGDLKLSESCAIIKYLTDITPGNDLVPANVKEQAIMWSWIQWDAAHFTQAISGYFWQSFVKEHYKLGTPDQDAMQSALKNTYQLAAPLEARLEGRDFIMGDKVSLADYALGNISEHQRRGKLPWDDFPNIAAYFDRLETLPAMQACVPPFDEEMAC